MQIDLNQIIWLASNFPQVGYTLNFVSIFIVKIMPRGSWTYCDPNRNFVINYVVIKMSIIMIHGVHGKTADIKKMFLLTFDSSVIKLKNAHLVFSLVFEFKV